MGNQKTRIGEVVSNKMDQTAIVSVTRKYKHKLYGKYIKRSKKYIAHDEQNECKVGDLVQIAECRPLSRRKRFRLFKPSK